MFILRKIKIIICSCYDEIGRFQEKFLSDKSYISVSRVSNAELTSEMLNINKPDAVIINEFASVQQSREFIGLCGNFPDIAFVFVSAYNDRSLKSQIEHYDNAVLLLRPVEPSKLMSAVNTVIGNIAKRRNKSLYY